MTKRMSYYTEENIKELEDKYQQLLPSFQKLSEQLYNLSAQLKNDRAREYLTHGLMRRLATVTRCTENIFSLYPISKASKLSKEARNDLAINLHAFFINISGILDNIAWIVAFEHGIYIDNNNRQVNRGDVCLLGKKRFKRYIPAKLKSYLNQQHIKDWYNQYSKNFRDALAHRIPLYIPPAILTPDEAENGEVAVNKARAKKYDIIFMDCAMPVLDGTSATRIIVGEKLLAPNGIVVAVTANTTAEDKASCSEAGMADFLSKPVVHNDVAVQLKRVLSAKRAKV